MVKGKRKESFQELWIKATQNMRVKHCMYPNCKSTNPIKAHALQNNGIISKLSENGHVLMPVSQRDILFPDKNKNLYHKLNLVGKSQATVFYGFCKKHDTELFYPIENQELVFNDDTSFLFAYRCLCAQLRNKEEYVKRMDILASYDETIKHFNSFDPYYAGCKFAIKDLKRAKKIMDPYITNQKDNPVSTIIWHLGKIKFASEGVIQPYADFRGNIVGADLDKKNYPLFVTIFPYQNESIALISWLKVDRKRLRRYIADLRNISLLKKQLYLTNVALRSSDDLVVSPSVNEKIINKNWARLFEGVQNEIQDEQEHIFRNASLMFENWGINLFTL